MFFPGEIARRYLLLGCVLSVFFSCTSGFESYEYHDYQPDASHRSRRSVAVYSPPQPSPEFPAILFSDLNYNNDTSSGYFHRLRPGEFRVWGRTLDDGRRQFVFRSMLFVSNLDITFKACCLTGNSWTPTISNIANISNIHLWMFNNQQIGGASGIFYTSWTQWEMEFSIKVLCPGGVCQPVACANTCYFGTCGIDGTCQCTNGHSGLNCETRPTANAPYPTLHNPILLFPKKNFQGTPVKVGPNKMTTFAENSQKQKKIIYSSLRVLYTRPLIFSRTDHSVTTNIAIGSDIEDLPGYMVSNPEVADVLWFNYATEINLKFGVMVDNIVACTNCSLAGGSCYTGSCVCLPRYSGLTCETFT